MGPRLVSRLARFLIGLFYRRVEVVGGERVPAGGPLILAANHQNALVDPMLLLATVPRPLTPIAKAPLFRHPLIGPFLRLAGAVPVHRRQEGGGDPARNEAMFRAASRALGAGGAIVIFPEGLSHDRPALMPLRTGTARMLLAAEAAAGGRLGVTLLPVGLSVHEPGTFRAGRALVAVGPPVETAECVALHATDPEAAVRRLTDRLAEGIRRQIAEAEDRQTLRLVDAAQAVWREEVAAGAGGEAARLAWRQAVVRAHRYLAARDPARLATLARDLDAYARALEAAGLTGRDLAASYPPGVVLRYAAREGLSLLGTLPLALWGLASHLLPYRLTGVVARWLRPTPDAEATDKIAVGVVLYPLCWVAEGWLAWRLGGGGALAAFVLLLLPSGFFAIAWRERLARVRRQARAFLGFLVDRDLQRRLRARRRALAEELAALARQVPDGVLVPPGPARIDASDGVT
jgi:1-acyl-sn-glycerol-3-phosphate acyltransferase